MDKLTGTILPVSTEKKIASIQVNVKVKVNGSFKVADIQLQEGSGQTQFNPKSFESFTDESEEMHFNFLSRGETTLIVPYMSRVAYDEEAETLPEDTKYITTPVKAELLIHKGFQKAIERITIGPGLPGTKKGIELNKNISEYTKCICDGYTSKRYVGGVEDNDAFIGRELRLANADNKFTVNQNKKRKTTGILYATKTERMGSL